MQNKNFAAVDIGTNSFHLIIVKVGKNSSLQIIDREKVVMRLGSQRGNELSHISDEEIEQGISILKKFRKLADDYTADIHAVATSAVREAGNKKDFLEKVLQETGIRIEVIDGYKEAEYIYKGVRKALNYDNKKLLCMDIGGGSTEYILGRDDEIIFGESIKIGAVRLSKKFFPGFIINNEAVEKCKVYILKQIESSNINFSLQYDYAIGASGTIMAVAGMINFRRNNKREKSLNEFLFTKDELDKLTIEILEKKTPEQRINIKGMEYRRADIIPAGLLILQKSFEIFNINEMVVSEYALREGVVLSMLEKAQPA
ncbi:MAG: Ppx/GppA family phosphatase [Ignavibacteriales bacterium]|nr:MAG: Ppx/GppA family phosphatase [Ignavibacteriales bacterium]